MSDGVVRVAPDSTGKFIDTEEIVVGANTVERQRIQLAGALAAAVASVLNSAPAGTEYGLVTRNIPSGTQVVQGLQPAATVQSGIIAAAAQAPVAATGLNVCTLSLRTFTGTTPSVTFKLQASDDGGTTWYDIQGVNNATGVAGLTFTQGAALAAGTGGPSIDYTIGGYTHVRVNVTAISGTSATAAFSLSLQSMPYEATPAAIAHGSDGTLAQVLSVTAKGTQGARGLTTQDLKDAGRSARVLFLDSFAVAATAETLMTVSYSADNGAATTGTTYSVTAGKRLRIQTISAALHTITGNTTAVNVIVRLRINNGGAALVSSPVELVLAIAGIAAANGASTPIVLQFPDGWEIVGGAGIGVTVACAGFVATTAAPKVDLTITGYEY